MSRVSYLADITERRAENGARMIIEEYTYKAKVDNSLSPKGQELVEIAEECGTTRKKLIALRLWARQVTAESEERLARELVVLITLNEARDQVVRNQYITKGEAAGIVPIPGGDILSLDDIFDGLLVCGRYILISEATMLDGISRYEPGSLLRGLIHERVA